MRKSSPTSIERRKINSKWKSWKTGIHKDAGPPHKYAGPAHKDAGPHHKDAGPLHKDAGPHHRSLRYRITL